MSEILPVHDGSSIVLVGSFNPRIFQPAWFVEQGLVAKEVESDANVQLINNEVCLFESDWFRVEVLSDRFVLSTVSAPVVEALRDLVLGTFKVLLHTPITKVGLNTHGHFPLRSESDWHRFGHRLAPKDDIWAPILDDPGTLTLTVQGARRDDYKGFIRVKVEPSTRIANGIFIDTNDEFQREDSTSAHWVEDVLTTQWTPYRDRVNAIRKHLMDKAYEGDS